MKIFDYAYQLNTVYDRDLHKRHSIHSNKKGKESVAIQFALIFKGIFVDSKEASAPIPVKWISQEKVTKPRKTETSKEQEEMKEETDPLNDPEDPPSTG